MRQFIKRKNDAQIQEEIDNAKSVLKRNFPELENYHMEFEPSGLGYRLKPNNIPDELMTRIRQRLPEFC